MNVNLNDFNYIDGLNTYPIQDYIDSNVSNININVINYINSNITSNISSTNVKISSTSNLNDVIYYNTNSNLIIANKYTFGDIYFKTSYNYPNNINATATKIDYTGKLLCYHNYNILQPTFIEGYYDVGEEIMALKADGITADIQLTALEAGAVYLQSEIDNTVTALNTVEGQLATLTSSIYFSDTYNQFRNLNQLTDYGQYQATYAATILNIGNRASTLYNASFQNGLIISAGVGIAGAVLSASAAYFYYEKASNALISNVNFTNAQKTSTYNANIITEISTYSNFYKSTSNMTINQGFISSNIINQQYINNLNVNFLKINNIDVLNLITNSSNYASNISNVLNINSSNYASNVSNVIIRNSSNYASNISNVLNINSSNYASNISNVIITNSSNYASNISNVIITNTNATYLKIGGGTMTGDITAINGNFNKLTTSNNSGLGNPVNGYMGGAGDRIILWSGNTTQPPYSLGMASSTLWLSSPTDIRFFNNTVQTLLLNISGQMCVGKTDYQLIINPPTATTAAYIQTINQGVGYNQNLTLQAAGQGGKVGIGTTNPKTLLHLQTSEANAPFIKLAGSGGANNQVGIIFNPWADRVGVVASKIYGIDDGNSSAHLCFATALAGTSNEGVERMRIQNDGNVCIGTTSTTYKFYVNGNAYINSTLSVIGDIIGNSTNYIYAGGLRIGGWDGNTLYNGSRDIGLSFNNGYNFNVISWGGNGTIMNVNNTEINLNQRVKYPNNLWNISADGVNRTYYGSTNCSFYCCGSGGSLAHVFMNSGYGYAFSIYNSGDIVSSGTSRTSKLYISGVDYPYVVNWNGTPDSGWFVPLNDYWYYGHAYLTIAISAVNVGSVNRFCWFGRAFLSTNNNGTPPATPGGVISLICDYRYPASYSYNNNYIDVVEKWDGSGNNVLYITISNPIFAGTMKVKIVG